MEATQTISQDQTGITTKIKTNCQEGATKGSLEDHITRDTDSILVGLPGRERGPGARGPQEPGLGPADSPGTSGLSWKLVLWPRLGPATTAGSCCRLSWVLRPRLGPAASAGSCCRLGWVLRPRLEAAPALAGAAASAALSWEQRPWVKVPGSSMTQSPDRG
uniref:Uncharacterized protein n=1 Tax=Molossus molossus TaxID=27622 RepID=A0A7J8F9C5_MOLMO|nr:hypothetical protein HJG59_008478 [Molossus molossus]